MQSTGAGVAVKAVVVGEAEEAAVANSSSNSSSNSNSKTPVLRPSIRGTSIQIFRPVSGVGALCTLSGGGGVTSVQSPPHARGKMCTRQDQIINEPGTSPKLINM